jgi:hypothetical protein
MHNSYRVGTALSLVALALIGACGTEPVKPASVEATSSVTQNAVVGTRVGSVPAVKVSDPSGNPMAGQDVTFAVTAGGGLVDSSSVKTNDQGIATPTAWTMGTAAGVNTVTATVAALPVVTFTATAAAGTPKTITVVAGDNQTATVGATLPTNPSVKLVDQYGNPVPAIAVTFSVQSGGGSVTGGDAVTDANGTATVGSWTLGTVAGANKLGAMATGVTNSGAINATALPGAPAKLVIGTQPAGAVTDKAFKTQPIVKVTDANNNTVTTSSASVTISVASGSGTLNGTATVAATNGIATFSGLSITGTGAHTLSVASSGLTSATSSSFNVLVSDVGSVSSIGGSLQATMAGTAVTSLPAVKVFNTDGGPAAGATVVFAVTGGGGSVTAATVTTDAQGIATVGSWTLGATGGFNTLTATVSEAAGATGNPVTFTASGCSGGGSASGYQLTLCFTSDMTASQAAAFTNAAARWGSVITGDQPDINLGTSPLPVGTCGAAQYSLPANFNIDDIVIFAQVTPIDGVGAILGSAGPCLVRTSSISASRNSVVGTMRFDVADIASMETQGTLNSVILHEMGHVLGIGTLWNDPGAVPARTLLQNPQDVNSSVKIDTWYSGTNGIAGFNAIGGTAYTAGNKVPVENTGGSGTANGHWRESVLGNELMTGFVSGAINPMSLLTVKSLIDLGYTVDETKADAYTLGSSIMALGASSPKIKLVNDIEVLPLMTIDAAGRRARIFRP